MKLIVNKEDIKAGIKMLQYWNSILETCGTDNELHEKPGGAHLSSTTTTLEPPPASLLYDFEDEDGNRYDLESETLEKALDWAVDWWDGKCSEEDHALGEEVETEGFIIGYMYNDEGERRDYTRKRVTLRYVEEASDWEEHGTYF